MTGSIFYSRIWTTSGPVTWVRPVSPLLPYGRQTSVSRYPLFSSEVSVRCLFRSSRSSSRPRFESSGLIPSSHTFPLVLPLSGISRRNSCPRTVSQVVRPLLGASIPRPYPDGPVYQYLTVPFTVPSTRSGANDES